VVFGDGLGEEGGLPKDWLSWPEWLSSPEKEKEQFGEGVDVTADAGTLRQTYESGLVTSLLLGQQVERADILYAAASLGWDLAGESLIGRGLPGVAREALADKQFLERCLRWAQEREACWGDPSGRGFHPWMPTDMRNAAMGAMNARTAAASGVNNSSNKIGNYQGPAGLAAVASDPEGTLVIHARLGDMSAMAWQEAQANAGSGHDGEWYGEHGVGWSWVPEKFPRYRYPRFPDCDILRNEREYREGSGEEMIKALEWDAGRLGGFVVSPLSFYTNVIEGSAPVGGGGWRQIVILTESCSADHPIIRALVAKYGAIVQVGSVVEDLTTMVLARHLVISSSTFSFMAALLGRATVIHVPHAGSFSLLGSHNKQCLTPTSQMDPRFVFHDVYRRSVDDVAAALRGEGNDKWMWRPGGKGSIPDRPIQCPLSAPHAARGSAYSWVHQQYKKGAKEQEQLIKDDPPQVSTPATTPITAPYYFLTWEELSSFYRNPACGGYYYPPPSLSLNQTWRDYVRKHDSYPLCTDTEWTFFEGERKK